ncbi:MAG: LCP family protein, partial [Acidimicrobiia bacterium]|nr:LCP family protein [Acidimicrobiia bacterium]
MDKRFAFAAAGLGAALAGISVGAFLLLGPPGGELPTTTTAAAASTAATTTTGPATTAVTTTTAATTTLPPAAVTLDLPGNAPLEQAARTFYAWLGDRAGVVPPPMAAGLAAFLGPVTVTEDLVLTGESAAATLAGGAAVAVVTAGEDVLLAVDEGSGWQIVGAKLPSLGLEAWYGEAVRFVMVIGTDARPGQNEPYYRGDSLHLLASNIGAGSGSIVGFPRDSWVAAPYGNDKLTHVNARAGSAAVVQIARDLTGLPIEGYLVTGFRSFRRLVDTFGGVEVEVPFAMNDPKSSAFLSAGLQLLLGQDALAFSRNRSISGSDFTRSYHQ